MCVPYRLFVNGCAVVLPIMYTATVMPFEIFFIDDATTTAWFSINIGITVVFFLDMVMNFNVGIYDASGWPILKRCVYWGAAGVACVRLRSRCRGDVVSTWKPGSWM